MTCKLRIPTSSGGGSKRSGIRLCRQKSRGSQEKIIDNPDVGKPLRYELAGLRIVRVPPFRILYELTGDCLIFHTFEHRNSVYS